MKKKVCGIYMVSTVEGKCLVGSSKDIARRWSWYLATMKANKLTRYQVLQDAFNEDVNNINFEILEQCDEDELAYLELSYFRYIESVDGLELINIQTNKANRHTVKDTSKMKEAQRGTNNPRCRINEDQAREIIAMRQDRISADEIAEKFGICKGYVYRVGNDRWSYLGQVREVS